MSKEEAEKFVKEVLSEKEKQAKELEYKIDESVKENLKKSGVAMKSDITALEKKIEKLEKTISLTPEKAEELAQELIKKIQERKTGQRT